MINNGFNGTDDMFLLQPVYFTRWERGNVIRLPSHARREFTVPWFVNVQAVLEQKEPKI